MEKNWQKRSEVPVNEVPGNRTKEEAKWLSIGIVVGAVLIGVPVVWSLFGKGNWGVAIGIAIVWVLALPIVYKFSLSYFALHNKCPSCGVSFHVEYDNEETITESVKSEVKRTGGELKEKLYRIGIKHIEWHCENCGYKGVGEQEYKKEA